MDFDKFVHNCFILMVLAVGAFVCVGFLAGVTWVICEAVKHALGY